VIVFFIGSKLSSNREGVIIKIWRGGRRIGMWLMRWGKSIGIMKELFDFTAAEKGEKRVDKLFKSVVRLIIGKDRGEDERLEEEEEFPKGKWGC
jgi:hypothetical protein